MSDGATQKEIVLTVLRERGTDGASAIEFDRRFGVYRAAAYVYDLRLEGWDITTVNRPGKTAMYYFVGRRPEPCRPVDVEPSIWDAFGPSGLDRLPRGPE